MSAIDAMLTLSLWALCCSQSHIVLELIAFWDLRLQEDAGRRKSMSSPCNTRQSGENLIHNFDICTYNCDHSVFFLVQFLHYIFLNKRRHFSLPKRSLAHLYRIWGQCQENNLNLFSVYILIRRCFGVCFVFGNCDHAMLPFLIHKGFLFVMVCLHQTWKQLSS